MIEEEIQQRSGLSQRIKRHKSKILSVLIVMLGLICFSLTIYALATAVNFFSYLFKLTDEATAKKYLEKHFRWTMATVYMSIFGMVIVVSNTATHFSSFTQKEFMTCIHLTFYLIFFICGIVAIAGTNSYASDMQEKLTLECAGTDYECKLAPSYISYRAQLTSFYIGYCVCFFFYAVLFHLSSFWQREQREAKSMGDRKMATLQTNQNNQSIEGDNISHKNISFVSRADVE